MTEDLYREKEAFRASIARFLASHASAADLRKHIDTTVCYDLKVWLSLCHQLEVQKMHIPSVLGGAGFGIVEAGIIAEEMGYRLYTGPYLSSAVMGGYALLCCAHTAHKKRLLQPLTMEQASLPPDSDVHKETQYAVVTGSLAKSGDIYHGLTAYAEMTSKDGGSVQNPSYRINGQADMVIGLNGATKLLVFASDADGFGGLFEVDAKAENCHITSLQVMDHSRPMGRVVFNDVAGKRVGNPTVEDVRAFWQYICVVLAHEMVGGAQKLLDETVSYLKIRYQFGRAIGSFQALKHRCAELVVDIDLARACCYEAAQYLQLGQGEASSVYASKAMASEMYLKVANEAIQMRGGIGFTWEDDTHFWYKRAKSSEFIFGTPDWHWEQALAVNLEGFQQS